MGIDTKLIDELLVGYKTPEQIVGENGLLKQLTKAVLERMMHAEMTDHLGNQKHDSSGYNTGNSRNGTSRKKVKGDFGEIHLELRGIGAGLSSRRSWPRAKRGSRVSTTRSYRCTRGE